MKNFKFLFFIILAGCNSLPKQQEPLIQNEFPEAQLVRCVNIPTPQETDKGEMTKGMTLTYITTLQSNYSECAIRHDNLIDMVKKENIKIRTNNEAIKKKEK